MPLLGALITTLLGGLATWMAALWGKKIAVSVIAVAALGTATVALLVTFRTLVAPLVAQAFSTQYGQFIGLAFPPVAGNCLATIAATWAACVLYKWQVSSIKMSASAS